MQKRSFPVNRFARIVAAALTFVWLTNSSLAADWVEYRDPGQAFTVLFPSEPQIGQKTVPVSPELKGQASADFQAGSAVGQFIGLITNFFLFGVALSAGVVLIRVARRLKLRRAGEEILNEARPPIVFLRSFETDRKGSGTTGPLSSIIEVVSFGLYKADWYPEALFAEEARPEYPCIAIGSPSARLPSMGAAKIYADDSHWQRAVEELCCHSCLVVIRMGDTAGLQWEIQLAAEMVQASTRLALLFCDHQVQPATTETYETAIARLPSFLREKMPPAQDGMRYIFISREHTGTIVAGADTRFGKAQDDFRRCTRELLQQLRIA